MKHTFFLIPLLVLLTSCTVEFIKPGEALESSSHLIKLDNGESISFYKTSDPNIYETLSFNMEDKEVFELVYDDGVNKENLYIGNLDLINNEAN